MKSDRSNMNTRQKVTVGVFVVVLIIVIWQVWGLFSGGGSSAPTAASTKPVTAAGHGKPGAMQPPMQTPQPTQLSQKPEPMSQREIALMQVQQETQAKYVAALNELQMLRVSRDIAETNQAIVAARLATVTAQKGIVDLLTPKPAPTPPIPPAAYGAALINPAGGTQQTAIPKPPAPPPEAEINYTVVSVSFLQYKWNAVLGAGGNLYNVSVGDILPPDRSKVVSINKAGVVLERNGVRKRISLVPII